MKSLKNTKMFLMALGVLEGTYSITIEDTIKSVIHSQGKFQFHCEPNLRSTSIKDDIFSSSYKTNWLGVKHAYRPQAWEAPSLPRPVMIVHNSTTHELLLHVSYCDPFQFSHRCHIEESHQNKHVVFKQSIHKSLNDKKHDVVSEL